MAAEAAAHALVLAAALRAARHVPLDCSALALAAALRAARRVPLDCSALALAAAVRAARHVPLDCSALAVAAASGVALALHIPVVCSAFALAAAQRCAPAAASSACRTWGIGKLKIRTPYSFHIKSTKTCSIVVVSRAQKKIRFRNKCNANTQHHKIRKRTDTQNHKSEPPTSQNPQSLRNLCVQKSQNPKLRKIQIFR